MKYIVITDDGKFLAKGGVLVNDRPLACPFPSKKRARSQMRYYKVKGDIVSVVDYNALIRFTHLFGRMKVEAEKLSRSLDAAIETLKERNESP